MSNTVPTTWRNADMIFSELAISPADLEGKTVLDVGAGCPELAIYARENDIVCDIISVDLLYAKKERRTVTDFEDMMLSESLSILQSLGASAVCGDVTALPFTSESFSMVVSNHAMPWHKWDKPTINELLRVLKPGGAFIGGQSTQEDVYFAQQYLSADECRVSRNGSVMKIIKNNTTSNRINCHQQEKTR